MASDANIESVQHRTSVRRRVARACDQCRARKSRCDSKLPCSACLAIGLQCSHGRELKRARGPLYVAYLERKVEELEDRISKAFSTSETSAADACAVPPSPHLSDDILESLIASGLEKAASRGASSLALDRVNCASDPGSAAGMVCTKNETTYLSTITSEPRGKPYGIDILRQLWNFCNQIASPSILNRPESPIRLGQALHAPCLEHSVLVDTEIPLLPTKVLLMHWVNVAFTEAFSLWPFVDNGHVERIIYRIYNTNTFGLDEKDPDDLAFLYALLALGQRFDSSVNLNVQERRMQGQTFFTAAANMVPLPDCDRSLTAVQTILCLALYLKAGSAQLRVQAHVSAAASAALRMGVHEHAVCFAKDEVALRRRLWSVIRVLDTYVSTALGIPRTTTNIEGYGESVSVSSMYGSHDEDDLAAPHAQLIGILGRAIDETYCAPAGRKPFGPGSYTVPQHMMEWACDKLDLWRRDCLALTRPVEKMHRSQLLLSYSHAYVQLLLFSPFVHYLARPTPDMDSPECIYGLRGVRAALHAVGVAEALQKGMNLNEAYLTTVDALAFAAMVLLVVEFGSSDTELLSEAMKAGKQARELLRVLSLQSYAAAECWEAFSVFWKSFRTLPGLVGVEHSSRTAGTDGCGMTTIVEGSLVDTRV